MHQGQHLFACIPGSPNSDMHELTPPSASVLVQIRRSLLVKHPTLHAASPTGKQGCLQLNQTLLCYCCFNIAAADIKQDDGDLRDGQPWQNVDEVRAPIWRNGSLTQHPSRHRMASFQSTHAGFTWLLTESNTCNTLTYSQHADHLTGHLNRVLAKNFGFTNIRGPNLNPKQ